MGGVAIGRSGLYHMPSNRLYLGQIVHKGERHSGRHAAIVDHPLFDQVQRKLASQAVAKGVEMGRADYVAVLSVESELVSGGAQLAQTRRRFIPSLPATQPERRSVSPGRFRG